MGIKDLFITPLFFILLTMAAIFLRPYLTEKEDRKYFLPVLWLKMVSAVLLGVIYQFYYSGGDTFNYFTHGSRWIWEAFGDNLTLGIKLLLEKGDIRSPETFQYSQNIWYYGDPNSYIIVKVTAFFDLLTFHTYSSSALFFGAFSFSGLWLFYRAIRSHYPGYEKQLLACALLVPSTMFWGSGILKDSVTLGAVGWLMWSILRLFEKRRLHYVIIALSSVYLILQIKAYVILCLTPTLILWVYLENVKLIRNNVMKLVVPPVLFAIFIGMGYFLMVQVGEANRKYSLDNIAQQAAIQAYDIRYGWGARTGGDGGYDLGVLDGTWQSMIRLMPSAVNVSLFRPYLWEVKNPMMLLSALESLVFLVLSIRFIILGGLFKIRKDPFMVFCLSFSFIFAFAVGISTYNFGTLMRYKIPFLPFFATLLLVGHKSSKDAFEGEAGNANRI